MMFKKYKNKLYFFALRNDIRFGYWKLGDVGIYSSRTIIRIPFFQLDIFED
jgi:hypothetical protein